MSSQYRRRGEASRGSRPPQERQERQERMRAMSRGSLTWGRAHGWRLATSTVASTASTCGSTRARIAAPATRQRRRSPSTTCLPNFSSADARHHASSRLRSPAADRFLYTADFAEPEPWWIAGTDGKPRESSRYERARVASLAVLNANRAARTPPAPGGTTPCPAAPGWYAALAAEVRFGCTAVVVGYGAVGLCCVIAAKGRGRRPDHRHESVRVPAGARGRVRRDRHRRRVRQGGRRPDHWR